MPQFYVSVHILVVCGKEISAASLAEAVEKSKTMKVDDFITVDCDHNDNEMVVDGVSRAYRRPKI